MPLQIDSLIASKIESQTITIQGAPASVLPTYIGDIYADKQFTTIAQTETAIETLLVPANFLSGLQDSFPYFNVVTETSTSGYSNLTLRVYVSPTTSFTDGIALYQETFELSTQPQLTGTFLNPTLESNTVLRPLAVKYDGSKISIISQALNKYATQSEFEYQIPLDGTAVAKGNDYVISTYDNFDVTTNQYLIITAEMKSNSVGVKTIFVGLKNSYNGLYANEIPAAQA